MASNTTYNRDTWNEVGASFIQPYATGVKGSAAANMSTTFDLTLADDVFIRGLEAVVSGASMGDTISISVIDANGVTGYPPGTVVFTPVSNWNIEVGNSLLSYSSVTPKKALATMKLRVCYNNTSLLNNVDVGINFNLLKILS